jgi:hypothetical protein
MTESKDLPEKTGTSPISRNKAFQMASAHFSLALETVIDVLRNGTNENARLGAARTIIDKVLPDLKASEITGENGGAIEIIFHSSLKQDTHEVQSLRAAHQSTEDSSK